MARTVSYNGSSYTVPDEGDSYGSSLSDYLVALASGTFTRSQASFPLLTEVDFGGSYGLKLLQITSKAANPAASGFLRLGNAQALSFRNAANSADLSISVNSSDKLVYNSSEIVHQANSIITNAMVSASAAIAYSKLSLTNSIVNTDVSSSAAIALNKLAPVTASKALVSDASGVVVASTTSSTELSYLSGSTSSIQNQLDVKIPNSLLNATGDIIYASAANTPAKLAIGAANNVLSVSDTGVPAWVDLNAVTTKTANYTLTKSDSVILANDTSASFTLTLPTAAGITGKEFTIKKIGTSELNTVTILTTSSQTIDGETISATSFNMNRRHSFIKLKSDGSNWIVLEETASTAMLARTTSDQAITASVTTKISFNSAPTFSGVQHGWLRTDAVTNNRIDVKKRSAYKITYSACFTPGTADTVRVVALYLNGTEVHRVQQQVRGGYNHTIIGEAIRGANAGDYFEVFVFHDSAAAVSVAANTQTFIQVLKV